jgi:hypothetical protein
MIRKATPRQKVSVEVKSNAQHLTPTHEPERNQHDRFGVQAGMDEIECAAIRDEGYDPDDPKVIAALGRVRAELGHWFNPSIAHDV